MQTRPRRKRLSGAPDTGAIDHGRGDAALVQQLAAAIEAHSKATGESPRQLARRVGMPSQNLYELLRRANDPTFDVGRVKLEKLAAAIQHEFRLKPKSEP